MATKAARKPRGRTENGSKASCSPTIAELVRWSKRLSGADLARALGVDRTLPRKWHLVGCPRNDDGTFDLAAVQKWRCERIERSQAPLVERYREESAYRRVKNQLKDFDLQHRIAETITVEDAISYFRRFLDVGQNATAPIPEAVGRLLDSPEVDPETREVVAAEARNLLDQAFRAMDVAEGEIRAHARK